MTAVGEENGISSGMQSLRGYLCPSRLSYVHTRRLSVLNRFSKNEHLNLGGINSGRG